MLVLSSSELFFSMWCVLVRLYNGGGWRNDSDGGKPWCKEWNLSHCHIAHHKTPRHHTENESTFPRSEAGQGTASNTVVIENFTHVLQSNLSEVRWWNYGTRQNSLVFVRLVMLELCQEIKSEYLLYAKDASCEWWWKGKRMLIIKCLSFVSSRYVCALPLTLSPSPILLSGTDGP
jgi:hypothetical protein